MDTGQSRPREQQRYRRVKIPGVLKECWCVSGKESVEGEKEMSDHKDMLLLFSIFKYRR